MIISALVRGWIGEAVLNFYRTSRVLLGEHHSANLGIWQRWISAAAIVPGTYWQDRHPTDSIIPQQLRARHWEGFSRVMETGASRYGEGDLLAVPGLRKDGQRISVEFTIVPLRNETGTITGLAAVMRDVTVRFNEIKALKQKLAQASRSGQGQTTS
jgi:hypothetical protein